MSAQWRLFLASLRYFAWVPASQAPASPAASPADLPPPALRFIPLLTTAVGCIAAGVYWVSAQLWPTHVAVVLSMLANTVLDARRRRGDALYWVFALLMKYNVLMALSAAAAPMALPAYLTLGLIMIAAQAMSGCLAASAMVTVPPSGHSADFRMATGDFSIALLIGLAPAVMLGVPGLVGVACSISGRMLLGMTVLSKMKTGNRDRLEISHRVTEICFYLGALATWRYV